MWSWAPCYQCSYLELYFNQNYLQWDGVSAGQAAGPAAARLWRRQADVAGRGGVGWLRSSTTGSSVRGPAPASCCAPRTTSPSPPGPGETSPPPRTTCPTCTPRSRASPPTRITREDDFTSDESESSALTNKSKASIAARGLSRTGARWRPGIPGMRWWASSTLSSSAGNKVNNLICLFVFHDLQNNTTLFAGNSFSIQEAPGLPRVAGQQQDMYVQWLGWTNQPLDYHRVFHNLCEESAETVYCVFQWELQKLYNIIL